MPFPDVTASSGCLPQIAFLIVIPQNGTVKTEATVGRLDLLITYSTKTEDCAEESMFKRGAVVQPGRFAIAGASGCWVLRNLTLSQLACEGFASIRSGCETAREAVASR
ncbi:hypothetical protein FHX59_003651 [Paraburkholderia silvatlantica]|uniref:Uncharacterized protein n=1 Tax=Paraburkholderia silvatlantica TaxID=321895 RepID=A0A2U1A668_9BURK|nr:hypothetical protein [Paraburkholderia silvatlantica]PVY27249.1 hypothetical protein C7411_12062 [Paraburkholderia silvatlantica]PXW34278.1 hypothetical protein C7413_11962 [Paraburkholderia silvatlantica]PYE16167.1 hypothetical protein C7410_13014 [Paraburkholderia silvatlantica]TDQ85173.1 hypothetical protein C7412_12062 [Paraburkholderia silvatlantica]